MKEAVKIWIFVFALMCFNHVWGATLEPDSISSNIFEIEKNSALQRISFEKVRIANDYKSADVRLMNLVDSVSLFILALDVPKEQRNVYLNRLQTYLKNINRYYSDSYLRNGTYLAVLSYYPVMIQWDQQGTLLENLKRYEAFSIKATRLIASDAIAEDFLTDYMKDNEDDIFRYADEYDDRGFARKLLEKALRLAPESAKRYYSTDNSVTSLLRGSNDIYVKKSFEIYNRYGLKSRAYILLDDIIKNNISVSGADSLGNDADEMFSYLVKNAIKLNGAVNYSAYRYMHNTAIDLMRKANQDALNSDYGFSNFKNRTPEEMFALLAYGYKETTLRTFEMLVQILKKRAAGTPISSSLINSLDKEALKDLIIHCDKNQTLDNLLSLVDDERKDYLLALTTMDEQEDVMPPFKQFSAVDETGIHEQGYRSMSEITKARPPKPVSADVSAEAIPVVEKPLPLSEVKEEQPVTGLPVLEKKELEIENPNAGSELTTSSIKKADIAPIPLPEIKVEPIKIELTEEVKAKLGLKKNILKTLQNIPDFIDKPYGEEILTYAAQREPDELFKRVEMFKQKHYCTKLLEECAVNAPISVKRYLYNPSHPVNYILQHSNNATVKKILEINQKLGYQSKPLLLLDDIMNNRITLQQAITVSANPIELFSALVKIISRPTYLGKYSIDHEMRDYSLRFVREINDKIASGASQPFYSVESFNSTELYFLMLYGRDEVFASTFNGLFNRFMLKLPNGSGESFMNSINHNQFRDFLSLCSNYDVLEEFLAKFNTAERSKLLSAYISNLEKEQDNLSSVVLVAEAISNLTDNQILSVLEEAIKKEYERVTKEKDQIGISVYGVLSSIISGNAKTEAGWYHQISQQFSIAPVSTLSQEALFNTEGKCIEQMYFYNDDDGRSSFINFMNTYKNQNAWKIEDKYNYVRISSEDGRRIEIFANKPEYEENGVNAINAYLKDKALVPSVIVHRGHSFHTEATLEKVQSSAKLIFVGSCGGFYKISIALENAPDAHIISTKQVGTKTVNDAMLFALNENIRQGKDIVWNEFWDRMKEKFANNQYFSDYIPPQKNLESTFIRAYYKILGV